MSLILSSSGLAAMLASAGLLALGVTAMLVRYPVAVTLAYLTFLAGVWLWLRYVGLAHATGAGRSLLENADVPDIRLGGGGSGSGSGSAGGLGKGGGSFDGGGASGSWVEARAPGIPANLQSQAFAATSTPDGTADSPSISAHGSAGHGSGGFSLGDFGDLDGEAIVLLILALAVVAAISSRAATWCGSRRTSSPRRHSGRCWPAALHADRARRRRRLDDRSHPQDLVAIRTGARRGDRLRVVPAAHYPPRAPSGRRWRWRSPRRRRRRARRALFPGRQRCSLRGTVERRLEPAARAASISLRASASCAW